MKKQFIAPIAAASAAALLACGVSAAPAVAGRKTCEAYIADITLDGKIDDAWNYAPEIKVDTVKENASSWFGDNTKVAGKDYATLTCKVLWDGHGTLYLLYVVKDNVISLSGANSWDQDSIEYFIQTENSTDSSASKIQKRLMADNSTSDIGAEEYGYSKIDGGFVYEIAVDISEVGGAGQSFGIDFQYNDDAEGQGTRNICLGWSDSTDKASSDPSVYGQCLLSDKTVASIIEEEKQKAAEAEAAGQGSASTADPMALTALAAAASLAGVVISKRRK